jgi:two-component system, LytTR family, sensor histidine kinase LytS
MGMKISYLISANLNGEDWWGVYLSGLSTCVLFLFLITMLKFFKDSLIQQQIDNQRFREMKQAELDNLKAQLSPHFLFNTLNNFYGLAVTQSKLLPDLMLRLSDLMRYSLYGTNQATVPLKEEIEYLKNYIEIEKIRLENTLQLDFQDDTGAVETLNIAPLILIVFVENAFKHSRNRTSEPIVINVKISVSQTEWLVFEVENNYVPTIIPKPTSKTRSNPAITWHIPQEKEEGGIGLKNAIKRLNVLYPNGLHTLSFDDNGHFFKIKLTLKLS